MEHLYLNMAGDVWLATDYPAWFTLLFWALIFIPAYPGLIMGIIALVRGKADIYMWTSVVVLAVGLGIIVWKWEETMQGESIYGLF